MNFRFRSRKFDYAVSPAVVRHVDLVTALGKWARKGSELADYQPPSKDIILLGDFNMPSFAEDDPIYKPIKKFGFKAPLYETNNAEGSNLAGDKYYDQIFFLPKHTDDSFSGKIGVFDFDNALFKSFWEKNADNKDGRQRFHQYIRYYLSDHRPLWAQFGQLGLSKSHSIDYQVFNTPNRE